MNEIRHEALRVTIVEQAFQRERDTGAEFPAYGQDRAGLNHDLEHLGAIAGVAQQRSGDDQVSGRGDGNEFGQALDDAEDQRDEQRGMIQGYAQGRREDARGGDCRMLRNVRFPVAR